MAPSSMQCVSIRMSWRAERSFNSSAVEGTSWRDLVGIASLDDLLPAVAEELGSLAKLVGKQADREA